MKASVRTVVFIVLLISNLRCRKTNEILSGPTINGRLPSATVLFSQPSFPKGVIDYSNGGTAASVNFSAVGIGGQPKGIFFVKQNQANPYNTNGNGQDLSVKWDVGSMTGFEPAVPVESLINYQRGIAVGGVAQGHTAVQIYGNTVGAFLNSNDLINGSPDNKMMIAASYFFPNILKPFGNPGPNTALTASADIQVPTGTMPSNGSNMYLNIELLFVDQNGYRIAYKGVIFSLNASNLKNGALNYDVPTGSVIVGGWIYSGDVYDTGPYLTINSNSAQTQTSPWTGFKTFSFSITPYEMSNALAHALLTYSGIGFSTNPADYSLEHLGIQPEMHYVIGQQMLFGWSVKNLTLTLQP